MGRARRSGASLGPAAARPLGLSPDDRAAARIGNRAEGIEAILAAIHAGVWMTPVNWHLTHLVPTLFVRLLRLPEEERAGFRAPALHTVLHGVAPVSATVKRRMIEWWGPILYEYWGGTDGGVTTFVDSKGWLAYPGTVGPARPQFEVFAVDAGGRRLPADAEGPLYARHGSAPDLFAYHGDPEKTAAAFLDPHTHTLGDVGRVDADGWVYLTDRSAHLIISGGVNIYPAEIEAVLVEHPAILDAAVFGIPDDEWGEQVEAAVELAPGYAPSETLAAELIAFARERLAGYKAPCSIDFEAALPPTAAGKLYVRRLRDRYWAGRASRIGSENAEDRRGSIPSNPRISE